MIKHPEQIKQSLNYINKSIDQNANKLAFASYYQPLESKHKIVNREIIQYLRLRSLRRKLNQFKVSFSQDQLLHFKYKKYQKMKVKHISLMSCDITDDIVEELSQVNWEKLKILEIQDSKITNHSLRWLSYCKFKKLKVLNISDNLNLNGFLMPNLQKILLNSTKIFHEIYFLQKNNWNNLIEIQVDNNKLGNEGLKYLIKCDWKNLRRISLCNNRITNDGIKILLRANWPLLEVFFLNHNFIGFEGIKLLSTMDSLCLKRLEIYEDDKLWLSVRKSIKFYTSTNIKYLIKSNFKNYFILYCNFGVGQRYLSVSFIRFLLKKGIHFQF